MARASAKRAKRARSNARNAQRAVVAETPQPVVEKPAKEPARPAPAESKPSHRSGLFRREKRKQAPKRPEDTMFFTRLRKNTKWVFVLLAVAFAIGFLAFGVGTGGGGIGDVIRDFFGGGSGTTSVADLQAKVEKDPTDGTSVMQLATLLQNQQRYGEATTVLEDYTKLRPKDQEALQQLASTYDLRARLALQNANTLRQIGSSGSFGSLAFTFPTDSGFLGALGQNPIEDAQASQYEAEALKQDTQSDSFYTKEVAAYQKLTALRPEDATLFAQLGTTAVSASDTEVAIAAYEKYLELEPDGSIAPQIKEQLNQLKALEESGSTQGVEQTG